MPRTVFLRSVSLLLSMLLLPTACAQTAPPAPPTLLPADPPGQTPEQPKGNLSDAEHAAQSVAEESELQELLKDLDLADHATSGLRTKIMHISENFITGLTETRTGTLTLRTDWSKAIDHPAGLPLRQFRVDFDQLILEQRASDINTSYIFDGTWLAERLEDEKQFNKWQVVRPGERLDPMEKMQGSSVWLPIGQDSTTLRARFHTAVVDAEDYFKGEQMGQTLKAVINAGNGSVQLRLNPRDPEDPTEEIRMWFDAKTFLPRAHAVLDGEGIQTATLFQTVQNPDDIGAAVFDTTTPPATAGWDATIRPLREATEKMD